jgi:orotidine-5'-phosphate decarboxylase
MTMRKDTRIILAMDETDGDKALRITSALSGDIDAVKINWPLVLSSGPEMITRLAGITDVICDLKVADIPNTVRLIVEGAVARGASAVIVHAFTGEDSMIAAVEAAGDAEIYAVTEMSHPGGMMFTAQHAEEMAALGVRCGAAGFIAPATRPDRIASIRSIVGNRRILSPGVGAQGGSAADAIRAGADHVIVGRSVYGAPDPRAAVAEIAAQVKAATDGKRRG